MNSMKRQKDRILKDELSRSVDAQYATGDQWRTNSGKNEEIEPKQTQHTVVCVTGDGSTQLPCPWYAGGQEHHVSESDIKCPCAP